jgi:hypothetical protein
VDRRERRVTLVIAAATLLAIPLIGAALVLAVNAVFSSAFGSRVEVNCDEFQFDRAAWKDGSESNEQEEQGVGLAECGSLHGLQASQVKEMLGARHGVVRRKVPAGAREWTYSAGFVQEGFGGEYQTLLIRFGTDHTVTHTHMRYVID